MQQLELYLQSLKQGICIIYFSFLFTLWDCELYATNENVTMYFVLLEIWIYSDYCTLLVVCLLITFTYVFNFSFEF